MTKIYSNSPRDLQAASMAASKAQSFYKTDSDWGALHVLLRIESRDFLSSWKRKKTACKAEQIYKMTTVSTQNDPRLSLWVKMVVILWICSALQAAFFFLSQRDSTRNSQKIKDRFYQKEKRPGCPLLFWICYQILTDFTSNKDQACDNDLDQWVISFYIKIGPKEAVLSRGKWCLPSTFFLTVS